VTDEVEAVRVVVEAIAGAEEHAVMPVRERQNAAALPSQRMPFNAVVVATLRPAAMPTSLKMIPSVMVATRTAITSWFGLRALPLTRLVSAELGVFGHCWVAGKLVSAFSVFST